MPGEPGVKVMCARPPGTPVAAPRPAPGLPGFSWAIAPQDRVGEGGMGDGWALTWLFPLPPRATKVLTDFQVYLARRDKGWV